MSAGNIGTISRISGPVVDVHFPEHSSVPDIFHAVEVTINGSVHVLECLQQLGNGEVRCISMRPTDGMSAAWKPWIPARRSPFRRARECLAA